MNLFFLNNGLVKSQEVNSSWLQSLDVAPCVFSFCEFCVSLWHHQSLNDSPKVTKRFAMQPKKMKIGVEINNH